MRQLGLFSIIIGQVIAGSTIGLVAAYWAVGRWGWPRWTMPLGAMAGLTLAFFQIVRQVRALDETE